MNQGRRKLLVASVGVATVSYAVLTSGCGKDNVPTTGNLPAPPPSATVTPVTGNLPAPPPPSVTPITGNATAPPPPSSPPSASAIAISGNLPAPPPRKDAGK